MAHVGVHTRCGSLLLGVASGVCHANAERRAQLEMVLTANNGTLERPEGNGGIPRDEGSKHTSDNYERHLET